MHWEYVAEVKERNTKAIDNSCLIILLLLFGVSEHCLLCNMENLVNGR